MTEDNNNTSPLAGMFPEEIAGQLEESPIRGRQLFTWMHRKRSVCVEDMTDMPKTLRARIAKDYVLVPLDVVEVQRSPKTGTIKMLFALADGETVESVLLRHSGRVTFCLSSQVGCALGCSFCATGQAGFRRDLSPAEIAGQALFLAQEAALPETQTPNIVYMGMGEPFQNYDAVEKSIRLLMHPLGMNIGARKITVSTVGDVAGIRRFAETPWQVRLSVSLHAADNELRSTLVPLNRRYPLEEVHEALRMYQRMRGRQITIEWTLMAEVNDTAQQATGLAKFLRGLDATVNVIPWNAVPNLSFAAPAANRQSRFLEQLTSLGIKATLRGERGDDIDAACGQLRALRKKS